MAALCFAEQALARASFAGFVRVEPPSVGPLGSLAGMCRDALHAPVGARPLPDLAARAARVAIIVSDASRDEPREEMLDALFEILPRERTTLVVAAGTHAAADDVVPARYRDLETVVHDATRLDETRELGHTPEGTPVRLNRVVADADLVVVTGRIRPHYFAGYSGGVKGLFPGCGYRDDILRNHLLKADPTARLGRVTDNRCRADLEAALPLHPGTVFVLNVLCDVDGAPRAAAAGIPILAHRQLVELAGPLFTVRAPRARVVVVADRPPVSRSLYQASKLLPPAGGLLKDGGAVVLVAECDLGVGPRERVNEGIYRLGVARALPPDHRVFLVSTLPREVVLESYAEPAVSVDAALEAAGVTAGERVPLVFRAGEAIVEPLLEAS